MISPKEKIAARRRRKKRIRKKVSGTSLKPRLSVYKSNRYLYAQLIDDIEGKTLASHSSLKHKKDGSYNCKDVEIARKIGRELGEIAKKKGIEKIVFDRSGYPHQGRIRALAEGVREAGLKI